MADFKAYDRAIEASRALCEAIDSADASTLDAIGRAFAETQDACTTLARANGDHIWAAKANFADAIARYCLARKAR